MNRTTAVSLITCLVLLTAYPAHGSDQVPAPPQDHPIALIGGTIHTVSGDIISNGTLLFDEGKIVAVGIDVTLPVDTERIDVTGKHVYPGLMAAHTILGLTEIGAVRSMRDFAELGDITPNVRAEVAINPDTELIPVTRANGILTALTVPAGGLIAGTSALVMLDGWTWEDMTLAAPLAMHVWWPRVAAPRINSTTTTEERIEAKNEKIAAIRTAFRDSRAYLTARGATSSTGLRHHDSDTRWEAMIPVIEGKIPVIVHANEIKQIQSAIDWAADEEIRIIIAGGRDAWRVADLLKTRDVPVIVGGLHAAPARRWENFDTPFQNTLRLYEAGVEFCISDGGGSYQVRNLPYQVATAASYGLPHDVALKTITQFPAEILGLGDRLGTIDPGKDATLIVTDGDPLEIMTNVERAFIQGRDIDLSSKHTMLYEKYQEKYRQLQK